MKYKLVVVGLLIVSTMMILTATATPTGAEGADVIPTEPSKCVACHAQLPTPTASPTALPTPTIPISPISPLPVPGQHTSVTVETVEAGSGGVAWAAAVIGALVIAVGVGRKRLVGK